MCYPGIHECTTNDGTNIGTTGECPGLRNKLIRRTVGEKRSDKKTMDELSVEVGVKESIKKKLVRSRLIWAIHVETNGR